MEAKQLIEKFYTSFSERNYEGMQECYHDSATFEDPVFGNLNSLEVKAMWQMLLLNAPSLKVTYTNVLTNDDNVTADWVANYVFTSTSRDVENHVHATFKFKDGLIIEHKDSFNFYAWSKQSLGFLGLLLGGTAYLKNKIHLKATKNLSNFIVKINNLKLHKKYNRVMNC